MVEPRLGRLFPSGGPADPDMMIGRRADVDDLVAMLSEGVHALIAGERRIGKTTVCRAVCFTLEQQFAMRVISIEVPERSTSRELCQSLITACLATRPRRGRTLLKAATPLVEQFLADRGIPLDLSSLGSAAPPETRRAVLELPRLIATSGARVVLFFDELQRVADYDDGPELLHDLADLYSGQDAAVVLVDGSHQRTFDALLGTTDGLGKLVHRRELAATIARAEWSGGLTERFRQAGHPIQAPALEELLDFGAEQPYPTMTAARFAALTAHRLGGETDPFCARDGIGAAERQLKDDGF
jgi:hypothetical protein